MVVPAVIDALKADDALGVRGALRAAVVDAEAAAVTDEMADGGAVHAVDQIIAKTPEEAGM